MTYPTTRYHAVEPPRVITGAHEEAPGWEDSPAAHGIETAPGAEPDPAIAARKRAVAPLAAPDSDSHPANSDSNVKTPEQLKKRRR